VYDDIARYSLMSFCNIKVDKIELENFTLQYIDAHCLLNGLHR